MFRIDARRSAGRSALAMLEVMFHAAVRDVRKSHANAAWGLAVSIFQTILMLVVFFAMFQILGVRGAGVRGDFLLYLMSGIFLFMVHVKAMGAVVKADGPTSPMMKHAPMNTFVAIGAAALSSLYIQILSMTVILYLYHALVTPISIDQPVGAMAMVLLSWGSGAAIGMVFLAAKPWNPELIGLIAAIYLRANMIASGKMFLANSMPGFLRPMFDWNPLFHTIDQARGFIFLNYFPHYTSIAYPVRVMLVCLVIGLMGEYYTRRRASLSWAAGR